MVTEELNFCFCILCDLEILWAVFWQYRTDNMIFMWVSNWDRVDRRKPGL